MLGNFNDIPMVIREFQCIHGQISGQTLAASFLCLPDKHNKHVNHNLMHQLYKMATVPDKIQRQDTRLRWRSYASSHWLTSSLDPPCAKLISSVGKRLYFNALTESERLNDTSSGGSCFWSILIGNLHWLMLRKFSYIGTRILWWLSLQN